MLVRRSCIFILYAGLIEECLYDTVRRYKIIRYDRFYGKLLFNLNNDEWNNEHGN